MDFIQCCIWILFYAQIGLCGVLHHLILLIQIPKNKSEQQSCFHLKVMELMNKNNLQKCPLLAPYIKAVKGIPVLRKIKHDGNEFFVKIQKCFFGEFTASYRDHVESVWQANSILPYILGGKPKLIQLFVSCPIHYFENSITNEDVNVDVQFDQVKPLISRSSTKLKNLCRSNLNTACNIPR